MAAPATPTRRRARRVAVTGLAVIVLGSACAPDPPAAVVGLVVRACDPGQEVGSGMLVAPDLVLTSAHVLKGADEIIVRRDGDEAPGTIVAFDPEMDLAYVAADMGPASLPEVSSTHVERGDMGTAWVVRGGEPVAVPVTVRRRIQIRTEDIYVQGETLRPGFELDAPIQSGDSGGAVVIDGKVVGVIWARSNRFENRAYAIDPVRAGDLIEGQRRSGSLGPEVDLDRC